MNTQVVRVKNTHPSKYELNTHPSKYGPNKYCKKEGVVKERVHKSSTQFIKENGGLSTIRKSRKEKSIRSDSVNKKLDGPLSELLVARGGSTRRRSRDNVLPKPENKKAKIYREGTSYFSRANEGRERGFFCYPFRSKIY